MGKDAHLRVEKYRKNETRESLLRELNDLLAPAENEAISSFDRPQWPFIFIVGAPRSGSTLLAQALSQTHAFGYVSNFVARFWMAPYIGARVEVALGVRDRESIPKYRSSLGVTEGWDGPHEFGYFWNRWFIFGDTHKLGPEEISQVDKVRLGRELAALQSVYQKPFFFKSLLCTFQIRLLSELFENSIFVVCKRSPIFQAQSLLQSREKLFGSKELWWSLRPKEYSELICLTPYEQVVGQVYYTLKDIEASCSSLSPGRFLQIRYDDLCSQPRTEVNRVVDSVSQLGTKVDWEPDAIPERFESKDIQRVSDEEFEKLREAAERYFEKNEVNS